MFFKELGRTSNHQQKRLWRTASSKKKALIGPWSHPFPPQPLNTEKGEMDERNQNALDIVLDPLPML